MSATLAANPLPQRLDTTVGTTTSTATSTRTSTSTTTTSTIPINDSGNHSRRSPRKHPFALSRTSSSDASDNSFRNQMNSSRRFSSGGMRFLSSNSQDSSNDDDLQLDNRKSRSLHDQSTVKSRASRQSSSGTTCSSSSSRRETRSVASRKKTKKKKSSSSSSVSSTKKESARTGSRTSITTDTTEELSRGSDHSHHNRRRYGRQDDDESSVNTRRSTQGSVYSWKQGPLALMRQLSNRSFSMSNVSQRNLNVDMTTPVPLRGILKDASSSTSKTRTRLKKSKKKKKLRFAKKGDLVTEAPSFWLSVSNVASRRCSTGVIPNNNTTPNTTAASNSISSSSCHTPKAQSTTNHHHHNNHHNNAPLVLDPALYWWNKSDLKAMQLQAVGAVSRANQDDPQLAVYLQYCCGLLTSLALAKVPPHLSYESALRHYFFYQLPRPIRNTSQDTEEEEHTLRGMERFFCPTIMDQRQELIQCVLQTQRELKAAHTASGETAPPSHSQFQQWQRTLKQESSYKSQAARKFARLLGKGDEAVAKLLQAHPCRRKQEAESEEEEDDGEEDDGAIE